jgi:hypothetical protein
MNNTAGHQLGADAACVLTASSANSVQEHARPAQHRTSNLQDNCMLLLCCLAEEGTCQEGSKETTAARQQLAGNGCFCTSHPQQAACQVKQATLLVKKMVRCDVGWW